METYLMLEGNHDIAIEDKTEIVSTVQVSATDSVSIVICVSTLFLYRVQRLTETGQSIASTPNTATVMKLILPAIIIEFRL